MAKGSDPDGRTKSGQTRADRQKAALKANMGRRKAQARARAAQKNTENEGEGPANKGE